MKIEFSDELISAYLDDELSTDERERVEQMLVDNAEHRRTFNELRSLRESLRDLPAFELDNQFANRVLQRAEKAKLSAKSAEPAVSLVDHGSLRVALIAITSVAAMLIVSLFCLPRQTRPTNVAHHDAGTTHDTNAPDPEGRESS